MQAREFVCLAEIDPASVFVMSRDTSSNQTKTYTTFPDAASANAYATTLSGCSLYEVLMHASKRCLLFFDLDRTDLKYSNDELLSQFISALEAFLHQQDAPMPVLITAALAHVQFETIQQQVRAHRDDEGQRQHLDGGIVVDELAQWLGRD